MRSQRHKLERIDIDELFSSPVNRGMLSFLERPPEEAQARLREKQKVNAADAARMDPGGDSPPGYETQEVTALSLSSGVDVSLHAPTKGSAPSGPESINKSASSQGNLLPGGELPMGRQALCDSPALLRSQDNQNTALNSATGFNESGISASPPVPRSLGESPTDPNLSLLGKIPHGQVSAPGGELPSAEQQGSSISSRDTRDHPLGNSPPASYDKLPPGVTPQDSKEERYTHSVNYPVGKTVHIAESSERQLSFKRSRTPAEENKRYSMGKSPPGVTPPYRTRPAPTRILDPEKGVANAAQPEALDGSVIGRRQKVRRAIMAQDGHSSGEQLLYQALWNAGSAETPETKLLSIGYSGMSALCKLEKSNCKKNVQGLIQKLAVEITEPHQSVSSTGTTYRIFSYKEILRRREAAGMIWVVRTSGVRFVDPLGNLPPDSTGELPSGAGGNSPPQPVGSPALGAGGSLPTGPMGKTPTQIERERNSQEGLLPSASENIRQLYSFARSQIAEFDDDACRLLWRKCKEVAPDCTLAEIIYCFDLKARQLLNERVRNVANPVGLMIWSVPKMFEGSEALYLQRRRAKAEEARKAAEVVAQFEQNQADWLTLIADPSTSEEDRRFYRKLLGDPNS